VISELKTLYTDDAHSENITKNNGTKI